MVLVDFAIVIGALFASLIRREIVRGRFVTRELDAPGDDPTSFGTRAWITLLACFSPNAYVVDVDADKGTVLLHDLVPFRKSEEPA
jgi:hypothetical protein